MPARKILFYTHALLGGGAERVCVLIASALAARGHSVIFAVDFEAEENRRFLDPRVRLVVLPKGHARAVLGLARLLRAERPDASLSAIGVSNLKHMLAALLSWRQRRAIISFHGFFASEPQWLSRIGNYLAPVLTRLCGRGVAVSDGLLAHVIAHGGSRARMLRIYNPVHILGAPAALTPAQLQARAPLVLYVGRFVGDKDVPTLLSAFAKIEMPEARLMLVGKGPDQPALEALAQRLGITERVQFAGYLDNPTDAYRQARCLALSSRSESFGNVVAEGLAHGLAVVSTACAGPEEILDHGRFGALVPVGDAQAMARALEAALRNPGDPAPRMARSRDFTIDKACDAYEALIEQAIAPSV